MSRIVLAITLACFALVGRADAQEGWSVTFSRQSVAAIKAPLDTVMVIPAGADSGRGPAAAALLAALRASGVVTLVMDSSALGDVSALDDRTIVARAAGEPVATFAIVRVFPGADRPSVVVAFYDKSGGSLGSVTADQGGPLSSSAAPSAPPPSAPPAAVAPPLPLYDQSAPVPNAPPSPPGSVPVTFTSASPQTPLQISVNEGTYTSIETSYHHGDYLAIHTRSQPLCTTPCTVQLVPGKLPIWVDGVGVATYGTTVNVPANGADVRLRVTSPAGRYFGNSLLWPGLVSVIAGGVVLGVAAPANKKVTTVSGQTITSHEYAHTPLVAGATILSIGAAMLAIGIPLVTINGGAGAASVHPRAATQPTAKLTVGPGSLGLRGSF